MLNAMSDMEVAASNVFRLKKDECPQKCLGNTVLLFRPIAVSTLSHEYVGLQRSRLKLLQQAYAQILPNPAAATL